MRKLRFAVLTLSLLLPFVLTVREPVAAGPNPLRNIDKGAVVYSNLCDFDVTISISGGGKTIDLPGGRAMTASLGLHFTMINNKYPSRKVSYNITGTVSQIVMQDGSSLAVSSGRSLFYDPTAGLLLAIGNFSWGFDAKGNPVQPLEGDGKLIELCALIK